MSGSSQRLDAVDKVTGRAKYTGDLTLPEMLHCKVVRSPHAHARIRHLDTRAAEALPGVAAVLTAADVEDLDAFFGNIVLDRPLIARDVVRFAGEPVVAVAADRESVAAEAVELVSGSIAYEPLPAVTTLEQATAADATAVHQGPYRPGGISRIVADADYPHNVCHRAERRRGDVEAALEAAYRCFDATYEFPAVYQYAMEPHTVLADFRGGSLTVWSSAQHPFAVRRELARIFDLALHDVRVIIPYVGGGFGSKSWTKLEPLAAAVAQKAGRPVRLAVTVPEAMVTSRRHNASVRVRTGVGRDGTLLARAVQIRLDTGAYTDNGPQVVESAMEVAVAPYRIPDYAVQSQAVFTHTPPAGSMRAIGAPQVSWACEAQLDEIAAALGLDPIELRRRNLADRGDVMLDGLKPADADLRGDLDRLHAVAGRPGPLRSEGGLLRGRGLSVATTGAGASSVATALLRLHADGSVSLLAGSTEVGQGSRTVLSRVAAEELGIEVERVRYVPADTDFTTYDHSTGASRTTTVMGSVVQAAARDLRDQLRRIAADLGGVPEADVAFEGEHAVWRGGSATPAQLLAHYFGTTGGELIGRGYSGRRVPGSLGATSPLFWEVAMGAAEVAVDPGTGVVAVERYTALADVGRAIHPGNVKGQEEGAVVMGLGSTLMEHLDFDHDGRLGNASMRAYRVPMLRDVPGAFDSLLIEQGDGPGPFGSRGIGEASVVPVGGAVAAALYWATGVPVRDLPLTPEHVWRLLVRGGYGQDGADAPDQRGGQRRKGGHDQPREPVRETPAQEREQRRPDGAAEEQPGLGDPGRRRRSR